MNREEKSKIVERVSQQLKESDHFYIADTKGLDADQTSDLRRKCFENNIKLVVVKNTLLKIAMQNNKEVDYENLYESLSGPTAVMFTQTGNAPAKLIKQLRKDKQEKPLLKGAYVEEGIYLGDDKLEMLSQIKSKEEVIGDIIGLLQSPAKNVLSALQGSKDKLAGIVKTLSEKEG
jgi:large subunit ribosomal protein L10